jgi:hypothetical protein
MAARLGTSYQGQVNNQVCARFYSTCPHSAQQMIHMFVTEDILTNETDPDNRPAISNICIFLLTTRNSAKSIIPFPSVSYIF